MKDKIFMLFVYYLPLTFLKCMTLLRFRTLELVFNQLFLGLKLLLLTSQKLQPKY